MYIICIILAVTQMIEIPTHLNAQTTPSAATDHVPDDPYSFQKKLKQIPISKYESLKKQMKEMVPISQYESVVKRLEMMVPLSIYESAVKKLEMMVPISKYESLRKQMKEMVPSTEYENYVSKYQNCASEINSLRKDLDLAYQKLMILAVIFRIDHLYRHALAFAFIKKPKSKIDFFNEVLCSNDTIIAQSQNVVGFRYLFNKFNLPIELFLHTVHYIDNAFSTVAHYTYLPKEFNPKHVYQMLHDIELTPTDDTVQCIQLLMTPIPIFRENTTIKVVQCKRLNKTVSPSEILHHIPIHDPLLYPPFY